MSLWSTCKRKQLTEGSRDSRADIGSDSTTAGPPLLTRSRRYCPSWNTIPIFTPSRFLLFQSSSLLFELITFSFPGPVDSPYMTASASEHLLEVSQKTSFSSLLALQSTLHVLAFLAFLRKSLPYVQPTPRFRARHSYY